MPHRVEEDATPARAEEDVAPAPTPTMEELWDDYRIAMWEALPPAEKARRETTMKKEEERRAASQAAEEARKTKVMEIEMELWRQACARAEWEDEDARCNALDAFGSKRLIYAWKWVDRVYRATEEECRWAPSYMASMIARARRQVADRHLTICEAEEEEISRRAGQPVRTRALMERRMRIRNRRGY